MRETTLKEFPVDGCPPGVRRHSDPRVKECHAGACRGEIVPLLLTMCRAVSDQGDLSSALEAVLVYMRTDMGVERAMINLHDRETGCIFIHKCLGLTEEEQARGVYFPGEGITGQVDDLARPIVVPRIGDEPAFLNRTGCLTRAEDREHAFLCVPILRGKKALGSISAIRPYDNAEMMRKRVGALSVIANMLAQAVELYLLENVDKVLWERRHQELMVELRARFKPSNIIGTSKAMMEVFGLLHKVARTKTTVLLLGESGVGKEMIAGAIHFEGPNPTGPLVKVNCAALPESILESELFGHERGAFTGAESRKLGLFELAGAGTLFLDEIGEMPLPLQVKLLRVLQERKIRRLGGSRDIPIEARIISATNRDIDALVREGRFRDDLFYRLNVVRIAVPPLRERAEDIPLLAGFLLERIAARMGKPRKELTPAALDALSCYPFPGNIRELENVLERAMIYCEGDMIETLDLDLHGLPSRLAPAGAPGNGRRGEILSDKVEPLEELERRAIIQALAKWRGNRTRASEELGISRRTILNKIKRYGL